MLRSVFPPWAFPSFVPGCYIGGGEISGEVVEVAFWTSTLQTGLGETSIHYLSPSGLCRALFIRPFMLLLDEPTNHLDLDACVWLEEELKT